MAQASELVTIECNGFRIDEGSYAKVADVVMKNLSGISAQKNGRDSFGGLTTTKLRSMYSLITNVYTRVNSPDDFEKCRSDIQYLKVKMAYESGRQDPVKVFLEASRLMAIVDGVRSYEQFKLYCRYAESLVAYFKFYGGKDN